MTEYSKLHWQIRRRIADGKIAMACDVQDITQRDITRMKQHTRMRKQLSCWTPGDVVADGTLVLTKHIFRGIPTAAQMLAEIKTTKNFGATMKKVVELTRSRKTPEPPVFGDTVAQQKKLADEVLKTEKPVLAGLSNIAQNTQEFPALASTKPALDLVLAYIGLTEGIYSALNYLKKLQEKEEILTSQILSNHENFQLLDNRKGMITGLKLGWYYQRGDDPKAKVHGPFLSAAEAEQAARDGKT